MKTKKLKNVTSFPQNIVVKGNKIALNPGEERDFPIDLASIFLYECGGLVQEVKKHDYEHQFEIDNVMWVANVTGAPWLKNKTHTHSWYSKQEHRTVYKEVEGENQDPMSVKWDYDPGMQEYQGQDGGLLALNLFKQTIVIPPFKRIRVPMDIGKWLLKRDRQQTPQMQGCLMKSRAPSDYEPSMSWTLEGIQAYLKFLDNDAKVGKSEAQIRNFASRKKGADDGSAELAVVRAKQELLNQLYFYLVNPQCRLPTQQQFEEFRRGKPLEDTVDDFTLSQLSQWQGEDTKAAQEADKTAK